MEKSKLNSKQKVLTIVGTRPELIKLSRVIPLLDKYTDHILVHTGQNFSPQLNEVFFKELKIRPPDFSLNVAGTSPMQSIAQIIEKTDEVLEQVNPDAVLVLGDTNSALAVIAAKRRKIPVFHLEAGNRSFDERTPEEVNRRIVDHVSDINLTYSEHARHNLLREGISTEQVFCLGSPMKEILDFYGSQIVQSKVLSTFNLREKKFLLVSLHREENVDDENKLLKLIGAVEELAISFDMQVLFSTHPRTKKRLASINVATSSRVNFVDSVGFFDFIKLQQSAFCVVSDSGTLTEESSLLQFPAVTLRESHERPEGTDVGTLLFSKGDAESLISSVKIATEQYKNGSSPAQIDSYLVNDFSWRVLKIINSYVGYVNHRIWHK